MPSAGQAGFTQTPLDPGPKEGYRFRRRRQAPMQKTDAPSVPATARFDRAPRWVRWYVWSFLAAFAVCGVVGIEAWPLTGFRLFSHLRQEHQTDWQAFALRPDGRAGWLPMSRFPGGYNGFPLVMKTFSSSSPAKRSDMCRAWATAAGGLEPGSVAVRIYILDRRLEPRRGRRAASAPTRALAYTCTNGVVQGTREAKIATG